MGQGWGLWGSSLGGWLPATDLRYVLDRVAVRWGRARGWEMRRLWGLPFGIKCIINYSTLAHALIMCRYTALGELDGETNLKLPKLTETEELVCVCGGEGCVCV